MIKAHFRNFIRKTHGAAAVEFALAGPVMLAMLSIAAELSTGFYQKHQLERAMYIGADFAANSALPFSTATTNAVTNLVKTGDPDGGSYQLSGWSDEDATFDITTSTYTVDSTDYTVVRLEASVPYSPMLPGLAEMLGFDGLTLSAHQEQVVVQ